MVCSPIASPLWSSWSNRVVEVGFGSADQGEGCQAAGRILARRKGLRTSLRTPSPGTRKPCHYRRDWRIGWPSCTAEQESLLICALSLEESCPPWLFRLLLKRHAPGPRQGVEHRPTDEGPFRTQRSLPEVCR